MMCSSCLKLNKTYTDKNCMRCKSKIFISIFVICDRCSDASKECSICLKKISSSPKRASGCGQCGK